MEASLDIFIDRFGNQNNSLNSVSTEVSPRIKNVILKPTDYCSVEHAETTLQVD